MKLRLMFVNILIKMLKKVATNIRLERNDLIRIIESRPDLMLTGRALLGHTS
jgi:hypothetical protein